MTGYSWMIKIMIGVCVSLHMNSIDIWSGDDWLGENSPELCEVKIWDVSDDSPAATSHEP